ncbi:MAG: ABC transporter permease [Clostridiales bacterium]|nr:ABC transporter permease [Clostridiales bacterium]
MKWMKKILSLIITLFVVSLVTFFAFRVIPGDSAIAKLGLEASEEQIEALREQMGLNDNLLVQYGRFLSGAVQGDFGESTQYNVPVSSLIADRFPVTAWLAALSFLLIVVISLPLGILASKKENGIIDRGITLLTQTLMAIPSFFLGIIIMLVFGVILKWFAPGDYVKPSENFGQFLSYMIFPALAVSIPKIAMMVKFLKTSVLRELRLDYVRTAKSKGQTKNVILYRHVLKNALMPVITFLGMITAESLAGSIVVEQVFNLPGMGRLLVTAIFNRDYPVVQAAVLYIAAIVVLINFGVDVLYRKVDPRIA